MGTTPAKRKRLRRLTEVHNADGYEWANTRWLRRQVYEGVLSSYRVAGRVLVDLEDLDAMVELGRRQRNAA